MADANIDTDAAPGDRAPGSRGAGVLLWLPGLAVALGAAIATAHGLFEVAVAARVPTGIAWLYPLITDGLALVAYGATARLSDAAARYAWVVVVTAAGLSGLAQATYLAGGPAVEVASVLRFGIGAWPAVAAAVVAHLLYLLAAASPRAVQPEPVHRTEFNVGAVQAQVLPGVVQPEPGQNADPVGPERADDSPSAVLPPRAAASPARDRAEAAASRHAQRLGAWPTVSELETAAEVSRGTAAAALKALRHRPLPLHPINTSDNDTTDEAQP
ncbi:hypothetical protein EV188_101430 [Actinomycetospora succinea]|uniref:DUF2637 domain-containing protein n=1 Tax=Actinomycetospora succinea TaxID=663603 RepID=A0A4R6VPD7_9PSEU|nr:hypothetical protein [Actinomycetospora succinea]TDQ65181.1 hypothetical protein EV188_101430 [Actinomycetospora succinea]